MVSIDCVRTLTKRSVCMSSDYRLVISSRGCNLPHREFSAKNDEEAIIRAKDVLDLQKRAGYDRTAEIIYLCRIDVQEKTTQIKINKTTPITWCCYFLK